MLSSSVFVRRSCSFSTLSPLHAPASRPNATGSFAVAIIHIRRRASALTSAISRSSEVASASFEIGDLLGVSGLRSKERRQFGKILAFFERRESLFELRGKFRRGEAGETVHQQRMKAARIDDALRVLALLFPSRYEPVQLLVVGEEQRRFARRKRPKTGEMRCAGKRREGPAAGDQHARGGTVEFFREPRETIVPGLVLAGIGGLAAAGDRKSVV